MLVTDTIKPIKRSRELVTLSREHHDGLLLCWKINRGLAGDISVGRIGAYILHFFDTHLAGHFDNEEQFVFPLLSADNSYRKEAELHHKALRDMIRNFRVARQMPGLSLSYFADVLDRHIRFEERVLFPYIETQTAPGVLRHVATQLTAHPESGVEWEDQFWLTKK
jgi:hemerythrin-like domain-containing protein